MKHSPAYAALKGMIPGRAPFGAVGVVEEINEDEETAFIVFERYDISLDIPIHGLFFIDPIQKQSIIH